MPENKQIRSRTPDAGTYQVILADPPWGLHQTRRGKSKGYAAAEDHYPVMSDERILGLGATVVADLRNPLGGGWVVMADPEGNEFCLD